MYKNTGKCNKYILKKKHSKEAAYERAQVSDLDKDFKVTIINMSKIL